MNLYFGVIFLLSIIPSVFGSQCEVDNSSEEELVGLENDYFKAALTLFQQSQWKEARGNFTLSWKSFNISVAAGLDPKVEEYKIVDYLVYTCLALGKYSQLGFLSRYILDHCQYPEKHSVELEMKWKHYDSLTKLYNLKENLKELTKKNESEQIKTALEVENFHFFDYCRDDVVDEKMKKLSENPQLFCRLDNRNRHPMLILAPIKEEILSHSPLLIYQYDLITDSEIELLKEKAKRKFVADDLDVQFVPKNPGYITFQRRESAKWIPSAEMPKLSWRHQVYTNLVVDEKQDGSDPFQVARYPIGGYHVAHYDFGYDFGSADPRGDRLATGMLYLNDVEQGGATIFPALQIRVEPKKGAGLLWFNLHRNENGNTKSLHAACPIIRGEKWISVTVRISIQNVCLFIYCFIPLVVSNSWTNVQPTMWNRHFR